MNIGVVLAKPDSNRFFKKNLHRYGYLRGFEYAMRILKRSGVVDVVVVLSEDRSIEEQVCALGGIYIYEDPAWVKQGADEAAEKALRWLDYHQEWSSGSMFIATVIYGTAIFWRPSWIRMAHHIIHYGRRVDNDGTSINLVQADVQGCYCFNARANSPTTPPRIYTLEHRGLNLDINRERDVLLASSLMRAIEGNVITPYPDDDDSHESEEVFAETCNRDGGLCFVDGQLS